MGVEIAGRFWRFRGVLDYLQSGDLASGGRSGHEGQTFGGRSTRLSEATCMVATKRGL